MRISKILLAFALAFGLVACGSDDEEKQAAAPGPAPAPVVNPAAPTGPTAPDGSPLLITGGIFQSEPVTEHSRRAGGSACARYDLTVQGDRLTWTQKAYDNSTCDGALLGEIITVGRVGELQADRVGTHDFSYTVESVSMIPHSILWTQEWGRGNSGDCQLELLPLNQAANIAGKKCGRLGTFPSVGSVFQGRYRFEGQNVLMLPYTPYELPNSVRPAESEQIAPRATRMIVRYVRAGAEEGGTDTATSTATSTDTNVGTGTDTSTDTSTSTSTDTSTATVTAIGIR